MSPPSIEWDFATQGSDYSELRSAALADGGWLTNYARRGGLLASFPNPIDGNAIQFDTALGTVTTLADVYFTQGFFNAETALDCTGQVNALSQSGEIVVNPSSDPLPNGAIDAKSFACRDLTDLSVAITGLHPRDVWLTRLEAFLPKASLERDLLLEPAQQTAEDGWIVADAYTNPPCTIVSATERRSRSSPAGALFAALLAVFAMLRRL